MEKISKHVVVLGSGPCGLYAARVLIQKGYSVTIIDRGVQPGGLATSFRYGNNWYDLGVHMFHARDPEIFQDIKTIMGDERIEVNLEAKIKWAGSSYRYPLEFQDMIRGIPFFKLCRQVIGLFSTQIRNHFAPWKVNNAEEALIQLYGKPLYKFFFEDFTHRYWDVHPKSLSATFVTSKMPKLTAVDVIKKGLATIGIKQRAQSTDGAFDKEILHYSRNGAEAMPRCLATNITESGGTIFQNATVDKVVVDSGRVTHIAYECEGAIREVACDECISTIPINSLITAIQPLCPENIVQAVKNLQYKPIVVYGLLVKKPKCLGALYVYYRDRIFHRVGEPKNAGLVVKPADHTVLIVEMTCEYKDGRWCSDDSVKQQLFQDLLAEGICEEKDVVEFHVTTNQYGYPIFSLGFEPYLERVRNYINTISNLQSVGRQGAFAYPNMHEAMRMGWEAADNIIKDQTSAQPLD